MTLTVAVEFHGVTTVQITSKKIVFSSKKGNKITVRDVIEELLSLEPVSYTHLTLPTNREV